MCACECQWCVCACANGRRLANRLEWGASIVALPLATITIDDEIFIVRQRTLLARICKHATSTAQLGAGQMPSASGSCRSQTARQPHRNIETDAGRAVRKERRCDVMSASNIPAAQTRRQRLCVHVTRSEGSPSAASSDGRTLLVPAPPETPAAERRARVTRTADEARKDEKRRKAAAPIGKQTGQRHVGSPLLAGALSHGLKGRTIADGPVC